jgi:glycosyltransferase involved in cell wall biosynthesis
MADLSVGILLQGYANWPGGIQYTENLARALRALPPGEQPRLAILHAPGVRRDLVATVLPLFDQAMPVRSGSVLGMVKDIRSHGLGALNGQAIGKRVRQEELDIVFPVQESLGSRFPIPWLAWIPDFQHSMLPHAFGRLHRLVRDWRFGQLLRESTRLVLSSNAARSDLRAFAGDRWLSKTDVLHFTCVPADSWFRVAPAEVLTKHNVDGRYFIVANQFWVHKNHIDVFEAVGILNSQGRRVRVVCTGKTHDPRRPGHFQHLMDFVASHQLQDQIRVLGIVPRGEQIALLRGSVAVIQPSRFEGWSTVVEEARALGRPIIVSDIAVHREQAHPQARYYHAGNPEELAQTMWEMWEGAPAEAESTEFSLSRHSAAVVEFARRFLEIVRNATG